MDSIAGPVTVLPLVALMSAFKTLLPTVDLTASFCSLIFFTGLVGSSFFFLRILVFFTVFVADDDASAFVLCGVDDEVSTLIFGGEEEDVSTFVFRAEDADLVSPGAQELAGDALRLQHGVHIEQQAVDGCRDRDVEGEVATNVR